MTTADLINGILDREGEEYTNHPADKGGPTKWGVTLTTLELFRERHVAEAEVQALTREDAFEALEHLYVASSGFLHILDVHVQTMLCDWAVNAGVRLAARWLQRTVGTEVDGWCGPLTIRAANAVDGTVLLKKLGHARQTFYVRTALSQVPGAVVTTTDLAFLEGWLNRNWTVAVDPL